MVIIWSVLLLSLAMFATGKKEYLDVLEDSEDIEPSSRSGFFGTGTSSFTVSSKSTFGISSSGSMIIYYGWGAADDGTGGQQDVNLLLHQLYLASCLRNNIVTVFGYIVNHQPMRLTRDQYTAIYQLWRAIKIRHVDTFSLLCILTEMQCQDMQTQFAILFRKLTSIVPRYLVCSAQIWQKDTENNLIDVVSILAPDGGALKADFFFGLNPKFPEFSNSPVQLEPAPNEYVYTEISELMGDIFARIFAALKHGKLVLTQQLFSVILYNLPVSSIIPHKEETQSYLIELFKLCQVPTFPKQINQDAYQNIYTLVKFVLLEIAKDRCTPLDIRNSASFIIPYIREPAVTFINKHYRELFPVVSGAAINFESLLSSIKIPTYPIDVVDLKCKILRYIRLNVIRWEEVSKSINAYKYHSSIDLLIAVLAKIYRMSPNLPEEVLASITSLGMYFVFKKMSYFVDSCVPRNFFQYSLLIVDFNSPIIPANLREVTKQIIKFLEENPVDFEALVQKIPKEQCNRARPCILALLVAAIENNIITSAAIKDAVNSLQQAVGQDGNPKLPDSIGIEGNLQTEPYPGTPCIAGSHEEPKGDSFPNPPAGFFVQPPIICLPSSLLPPPQYSCVSSYDPLAPIRAVLAVPNIYQILNINNVVTFTTRGELLKHILTLVLTDSNIKTLLVDLNIEIIRRYLTNLDVYITQETKILECLPKINWELLVYSVIPAPKSPAEIKTYNLLITCLLQRSLHVRLAQDGFNAFQCVTIGRLLKEVITMSLKYDLAPDIADCLKYYQNKVNLIGIGQQCVSVVMVIGQVKTNSINLQELMDAINEQGKQQAAYQNIVRFMQTSFSADYIKRLDPDAFNTQGYLLKAIFNYMEFDPTVPDSLKKDFSMLQQYIRLDYIKVTQKIVTTQIEQVNTPYNSHSYEWKIISNN